MYFYYSQPIRWLLILKQSILSNKDYSHGNICSFESCQYMHNYTVLAILPMLNKMLYCHIPWSLWMWIIPALVGPAKKYNHIVYYNLKIWRLCTWDLMICPEVGFCHLWVSEFQYWNHLKSLSWNHNFKCMWKVFTI